MPRASSPLILLATLAGGVVVGLAAGRGGPFVSAQVGGENRVRPAASSREAPPLGKAAGEDDLYQKLARQYEQFEHVNRTFELVAEAVSPAVVHIVAQKTGPARNRRYEETGSGVIVRADQGSELYVLTNHHVIDRAHAEEINIFLRDGSALHPRRLWLDDKADIAVLALGRNDLPAARLGDSDAARVGSWVLALGSPFGLTHSVSQGIISARSRHMNELQEVENQDFLQTDAAINPGNSGGPLVNLKGEVIGINNSIASNGGGNEGVGFSIPINLARWIMNQLISNGKVTRGALGIDLRPEFKTEDALAKGLDRPRGAWVNEVHPRSPAAEGGLLKDDVILRFRGVEVQDLNHLINMVSMAPIGQPADLVVLREGKRLALSIRVGRRGDDKTVTPSPPAVAGGAAAGSGLLRRQDRPDPSSFYALGLELSMLNEAMARLLNLPEGYRGAVVLRVTPDSRIGSVVRQNDVISRVDGRPIGTSEEAVKALNRPTSDLPLLLEIDRRVGDVIERRSVRVP